MNFYTFWNLGLLFRNTAEQRTSFEIALIIGGFIVTAVAAYLLGSINLSIIISSKFYNDDIRQHGSGNAGMTNVMRTYGKKMAAITFLGDFLKAVVASLVGRVLLGYVGAYIAGLFCVLGHIYPCFYKFKGGKGVVTAAAMVLMTNPVLFVVVISIFIIIVAVTKYISLGSVVALLSYPILLDRYPAVLNAIYKGQGSVPESGVGVIITFIVALLGAFAHRENIKRILRGEENKFTFKVKDKKTVSELSAEEKEGGEDGGEEN